MTGLSSARWCKSPASRRLRPPRKFHADETGVLSMPRRRNLPPLLRLRNFVSV
jgi:hypothetical protein